MRKKGKFAISFAHKKSEIRAHFLKLHLKRLMLNYLKSD